MVNSSISVRRRKQALSGISQRWLHSHGWDLRQGIVLWFLDLWLPNWSFQSCPFFIVQVAVLQQDVYLPSGMSPDFPELLPLAPRELLLVAIARSSGAHAVSKEAESRGSRLRNGEQHHDLPNAHKIYSQMLCVLLHFKSLSQFLPSGIVLLNNSSLESKWNNFVKTRFTLPCFHSRLQLLQSTAYLTFCTSYPVTFVSLCTLLSPVIAACVCMDVRWSAGTWATFKRPWGLGRTENWLMKEIVNHRIRSSPSLSEQTNSCS